jgi:hypothetical protein
MPVTMAPTANTTSSSAVSGGPSRGLASRIIPSAVAFGMGLLLVNLGAPRFEAAVARLPADATMMKIRDGISASADELAKAGKAAESSLPHVADPEVVAMLGRLRLAAALAAGIDSESGRRQLTASEAATRSALGLAPGSPFEWLQLSYIAMLGDGGPEAAAASLRMSLVTGRYAYRLVLRRLDFALAIWNHLDVSLREEVAGQVKIVAVAYPSYLAILAWHYHRVGEIRDILAGQPEAIGEFNKYLVWQGPRSYADNKNLIFAH